MKEIIMETAHLLLSYVRKKYVYYSRREKDVPGRGECRISAGPPLPLPSKGAMPIASKLEEDPKRRFTVVKSACPCGLRVGNERIILSACYQMVPYLVPWLLIRMDAHALGDFYERIRREPK